MRRSHAPTPALLPRAPGPRRRWPRRLAPLLLLLAIVTAWISHKPEQATANGAYTHIYISQLAVLALPPGPLRDLLTDPALAYAYETGSIFPDSGYAASDDYGEQAHWTPFQEAYLVHLRERFQGDYSSPEARAQVAFLLGMASHGLADQTYDTTLLARAFAMGDTPDADFDRLADYFVILDVGVLLSSQPWAPYDDLVTVFRDRVGYAVSEGTLTRGMTTMSGVISLQRRAARAEYLDAWRLYPWLGTHINNPAAPGSLPHLGDLVAAYWLALWGRLHGTATLDTHLLIASIPLDGAENFPTDPALTPYHRVGLVFGYGVRRSQIQDKLRLLDPNGDTVPTRLLTPYNGDLRNFMTLEPLSPLSPNTLYTVELDPGVESLQGEVSTATYRLSFRTQCPPDALDACPPLPPPLLTGPIPTEPPPIPSDDTSPTEDTTSEDTASEDTSPPDDTSPAPSEDTATSPQPDPQPPTPDTSTSPDTSPAPAANNDSDTCACGAIRATPSRSRPPTGWATVGLLISGLLMRRRRG